MQNKKRALINHLVLLIVLSFLVFLLINDTPPREEGVQIKPIKQPELPSAGSFPTPSDMALSSGSDDNIDPIINSINWTISVQDDGSAFVDVIFELNWTTTYENLKFYIPRSVQSLEYNKSATSFIRYIEGTSMNFLYLTPSFPYNQTNKISFGFNWERAAIPYRDRWYLAGIETWRFFPIPLNWDMSGNQTITIVLPLETDPRSIQPHEHEDLIKPQATVPPTLVIRNKNIFEIPVISFKGPEIPMGFFQTKTFKQYQFKFPTSLDRYVDLFLGQTVNISICLQDFLGVTASPIVRIHLVPPYAPTGKNNLKMQTDIVGLWESKFDNTGDLYIHAHYFFGVVLPDPNPHDNKDNWPFKVLAHELTHSLVPEHLFPDFFNEGIAEMGAYWTFLNLKLSDEVFDFHEIRVSCSNFNRSAAIYEKKPHQM